MKTTSKLPKALVFLMLVTLISTGVSCKDQNTKTDSTVKIEDDENYGGSSKREDICQLFNEDDVRSVFDLSEEVEIEQTESKNAICSYGWWSPDEEYLYYSVSLNFASGEKRTHNQIDAVWEGQNEDLYNRHQLQEVSGVGDKASWSNLGGGQLRVASNGFIFYVSLTITHATSLDKNKESPLDTQTMIDKTSALAKQVIKNM